MKLRKTLFFSGVGMLAALGAWRGTTANPAGSAVHSAPTSPSTGPIAAQPSGPVQSEPAIPTPVAPEPTRATVEARPDIRVSGRVLEIQEVQADQDTIRARYPEAWELPILAGTVLDSLRTELLRDLTVLPATDLEDQTRLPLWFRLYLRRVTPDLPTTGPYQYPRTAPRLLQWMVAHPDTVPEVP